MKNRDIPFSLAPNKERLFLPAMNGQGFLARHREHETRLKKIATVIDENTQCRYNQSGLDEVLCFIQSRRT